MNFTVEGARFGQTDGVQGLRKYEIWADLCVGLACDGLSGAGKDRVFSTEAGGREFDGLPPLQGSGLMGTFPRAYARG